MLKIDIERPMLTSEGKKTLKICSEIADRELLCLFGHSGSGKNNPAENSGRTYHSF